MIKLKFCGEQQNQSNSVFFDGRKFDKFKKKSEKLTDGEFADLFMLQAIFKHRPDLESKYKSKV